MKEEERKRRREREKPCDMGTHRAKPPERSYGDGMYIVQMVNVCREIEQIMN